MQKGKRHRDRRRNQGGEAADRRQRKRDYDKLNFIYSIYTFLSICGDRGL